MGKIPKLADPQYKGPGKPVHARQPVELAEVREGRFCGKCASFVPPEKARPFLEKDKFWERAFGQFNDGHDLKPWMFGDLNDYGICERHGMCAHFFSHCETWTEKREFGRIFVEKILGKK